MTRDIHDRLLTLDSHIDIPWPDRNDFETGSAERQVDLPKLRAGGLKAVCLAAYIPQTRLEDAPRQQAWERVQAMLEVINGLGSEAVSVCASVKAVREAVASGRVAVVPAVENGHALGGDLSRVDRLAAYGVRYMTLTHNGHNDLADAAIPLPALGNDRALHGGLSPLGRAVIARMNETGIVVDVSHAAKTTMMQAVALSSRPIVASHSCARALCDHPRNLDDEQLLSLRDAGGVIQITAMSSFLKPSAQGRASVADLARHVRYVADLIGVAHVGVSSDFDGGGQIEGWADASQTASVTEALRREGFAESELAAIWGGNFLRVLEQAEAR
ncbi:membrane dipeptidase [Asaia siamensis]|uniref:Peptidase M19 n=1 Tax=Asaia siamensis TaxID=110479 RepID=A0ABQ1M2B4_9PROT|nr:dipeptidase [Asaia siamensis]GBR10717.1 dipeptidase [Asaia siamensis NRIC 0323]GGC31972.1 peptidase M19 [Asaia siamensis]